MINFINSNLRCDFCSDGILYYDPSETTDSYFVPETFMLSEIKEIIDTTINEYLVFKCPVCGMSKKYTLKNIEKKIREDIYKVIKNMVSIKEFKKIDLNSIKKIFIYCGKCDGFDGKGSCPIRIYKDCKLKRLPDEL